MKQVRETKAGKSISAWVVLDKKNKVVANVQAHYSDSGAVTVDVWTPNGELQQGRASGWGYDKTVAAMRGIIIDGITLTDHCGEDEASKRLLKRYIKAAGAGEINRETQKNWGKKAAKMGARFANWSDRHYNSLHIEAGLDRLASMGYRVLTAI